MSEIDLQECRDVAWAERHVGKYKAAAKRLEMLCDEVERLRKENARLREALDDACEIAAGKVADRIRAVRERTLKDTEE